MQKIRSIPKINCNDCLKRPSCTSLCPAAEAYVSQDNVPGGRELLVSSPEYAEFEWPENDQSSSVRMSDRYVMVLTLISAGIPRKIIEKNLKLTPPQLSKIIHKIKRKLSK